jgi:hypothetical protein
MTQPQYLLLIFQLVVNLLQIKIHTFDWIISDLNLVQYGAKY